MVSFMTSAHSWEVTEVLGSMVGLQFISICVHERVCVHVCVCVGWCVHNSQAMV